MASGHSYWAAQLQGFLGRVFRSWDFKMDCAFIAAGETKSNTGEIHVCVWCGEGVQIQLLRKTVELLIHWILQNWVQIQELPLTGWESLGKSLYLRPNFLLWKLVLTLGKSCRLNEIIHVKHLTQYMAYFTYLIMADIIIIPLRQN